MVMNFSRNVLNYIRQYPSLKQFIKFCIVGGTSALINFVIYYSFTQFLFVWYIYSAIWGFCFSAIFNFTVNKLWTFRNKERGRRVVNQLVKFLVVIFSGLIFNTAIIYGLTELAGIHWLLSWVFATGLVTFWNFSFNRFWTFKHHQPPTELLLE